MKSVIDDSITIRDRIDGTTVLNFFGNTGGIFLKDTDKKKKKLIKVSLEKDKKVKEVIFVEKEGFPDLFIILKDKYLFNHESSLFVSRGRNSINHSEYGLFIAYGKDITKGT
ncbi:MAG: hypothetical protein ACFFG0_54810, partial [Candidatus Thorarchaeota archaeon]